ncbi:hypothetical protein D918_07260 [Trichuris suis]|nr:hypothetical protein D918_07260 [Trichuris suis]
MIFFGLLVISVILAVWTAWSLTERNQFWKKRGICGPKPELLFGNLRELRSRSTKHETLQKWTETYGKVYGKRTTARWTGTTETISRRIRKRAAMMMMTSDERRRNRKQPRWKKLAKENPTDQFPIWTRTMEMMCAGQKRWKTKKPCSISVFQFSLLLLLLLLLYCRLLHINDSAKA